MKITFLKNWLIYSLILFVLGVVSYRFSETTGRGPVEYGVFTAYGVSLMEDGDMNIINQLPDIFAWMITESGSDVDYHEYGKASIALPLLFLAKLFKLNHYPNNIYYHFFFILFNLGIVYLWINLLNRTCQLFLGEKANFKWVIALFFFNIPVWWYSFFHVNGSDLIACLLFNFIIYTFLKNLDVTKWSYLISQAALLMFAAFVKVTFLFYLPLWGFYLYHHSFNRKMIGKVFCAHVIGFVITYLPHTIFQHFKYGQLMLGHSENFRPQFFVLWETLFSQNGYFVSTPFYLLSLAGFLYLTFKKKDVSSKFLLYMGFWFVVKLILVSFRPIEDELFGARMIMLDSYLFLPLGLLFIKKLFGNHYIKASYAILGLGSLYSFYLMCIFLSDQDAWNAVYNFKLVSFQLGLSYFKNIINSLNLGDFTNFAPYLFLSVIISGVCLAIKNLPYNKTAKAVTLSILTSFLIGHVLHLYNFKDNVETLRAYGFYEDKLMAEGPRLFIYDDTVSVFDKSMFNAKKRGDEEGYLLREKVLKEYYKKIKPEILHDPIGFTESLETGNYRASAHSY